MKFTSILNREECRETIQEEPTFFVDLNINQLVEAFQSHVKGYDIKSLFYRFPSSIEEIQYRLDILQDLKKDTVYERMKEFSARIHLARQYFTNSDMVRYQVQKEMWALNGAVCYLEGWEILFDTLESQPMHSEGCQTLLSYLREWNGRADFQKWKQEASEAKEWFRDVSLELTLTAATVSVSIAEEKKATYHQYLQKLFPKCWEDELQKYSEYISAPFGGGMELNGLEVELIELLKKQMPNKFRSMHRFFAHAKAGVDEVILRLEEELQFYLSYLAFQKEMLESGFAFCVPQVGGGQEMQIEGVYDLALAYKGAKRGRRVVTNDAFYSKGEQFFVVTGPNQGGKTTFARSVGQAVYFAMMGLDVPADRAVMPRFSGIITHFSVEESVETGRGKLKEELTRLQPMMKEREQGQFVILNELFTTAATYDSYIMGKNVMKHFIQNACMGIYVTHIMELADCDEAIVSLVATATGDATHQRTYRIVRKEAEGIGYAGDMAERYHLTYPLLKERLANLESN